MLQPVVVSNITQTILHLQILMFYIVSMKLITVITKSNLDACMSTPSLLLMASQAQLITECL